ncbi:fumarylacetoacetate hydrolase family protein [Paraneptunicella aestuarii]|nr:fumarylacetoacetate hydrolase family protein [Paraneptunicella aestuarii]UAA40719.1 fumarylacetoacetate hydrolase family protein [Paraneptunicella aestuarii]
MYQHYHYDGSTLPFTPGKAVCVGRNYADHIQELNNSVPDEPLLFIKPSTAMCKITDALRLPDNSLCHNELEVALLIAETLPVGHSKSDDELYKAIWGVGLALDLTLRDKQSELKERGYPWERAKAFDNSCPLSAFVPFANIHDVQNLDFTLDVNQQRRQTGNTSLMLTDCLALIREITTVFTLCPGDVVLTGTPKGVGALNGGDKLHACLYNSNSDLLIDVVTQVG